MTNILLLWFYLLLRVHISKYQKSIAKCFVVMISTDILVINKGKKKHCNSCVDAQFQNYHWFCWNYTYSLHVPQKISLSYTSISRYERKQPKIKISKNISFLNRVLLLISFLKHFPTDSLWTKAVNFSKPLQKNWWKERDSTYYRLRVDDKVKWNI